MEKISAACAMEWSIQLDKGLRSKRPGESIAAVDQIGPKLVKWSREPIVTLDVSKMYNMIQGEDRMFANTILLRLADVFSTGDKQMKSAIVKLFLLELTEIMKKGGHYNGILAKHRVPNHFELLRRVKCVYDTGDVEDRSLSLRLYGCWADLAKDNADVRYMVLSSLQSSHELEVKASIFAASCISRLSDDFAYIILTLLGTTLCSKASCSVKIAAVRAFSKMQSSLLILSRAYKFGKNLMQKFDDEVVTMEMVLSLSKLASKSISLAHRAQAEILMPLLNHDYSSLINARALKCLLLLFQTSDQCFPINWNVIIKLFQKIDDADLSVVSYCDALRVLRKAFQYNLQNLPTEIMPDFVRFLSVLVKTAKSSVAEKQSLIIGLLVDISCNLKNFIPHEWPFGCISSIDGFQELGMVESNGSDSLHFSKCVSCLIIDVMVSSLKYASTNAKEPEIKGSKTTKSKLKPEFQMFYFLLHLIEQYPNLCHMVLTKISSFIIELSHVHHSSSKELSMVLEASQEDMNIDNGCSSSGFIEADEKYINIPEIISCFCKFIRCCLNILDCAGVFMSEVYDIVKYFTETIPQNLFGDSVSYEIFSIHFHSGIIWHGSDKSEETFQWMVHHEYQAFEFSKKMLKRNKWVLYKAAMKFACKGLWLAAAFSFRKLIDHVKSNSFYRVWLRFLVMLAGSENEIKMLLYPKFSVCFIAWLNDDDACEKSSEVGDLIIPQFVDLQEFIGKLSKIYERVHSSETMLASSKTTNVVFSFQLWFVYLRSKVLKNMVDILGILASHNQLEKDIQYIEISKGWKGVALHLVNISYQFQKLAMEYDLLATSFVDIDQISSQSIATLALNCSLLAFCTSFPLYFSKSYALCSHFSVSNFFPTSIVVQDLIERLWDVDNESALNLLNNLSDFGDFQEHLHSRTHKYSSTQPVKSSIMAFRSVISDFTRLRNAEEAKGFDISWQYFKEGMHLLHGIAFKWMDLHIQAPRYFFRPRSCITSEIFIYSADSMTTKIKVSLCTPLSLNLSIQLKNASPDLLSKITKIYCILVSRSSDILSSQGDREEHNFSNYKSWKSGIIADLSVRLLRFMSNDMNSITNTNSTNDGNTWATSFVCFEQNHGQGFSTCLLDVSKFPEGVYPIHWHSCFIKADGTYWNLLPKNLTTFTITKP